MLVIEMTLCSLSLVTVLCLIDGPRQQVLVTPTQLAAVYSVSLDITTIYMLLK